MILTIGEEHHDSPIEIDAGCHEIRVMMFSAKGEYLVSGHTECVRVSRVEDGKEMATLEAKNVTCLAVSKDGNWIAAGTLSGDIIVWNANTYRQVLKNRPSFLSMVYGVDFSPDSTRLIAASYDGTLAVTIWKFETGSQVLRIGERVQDPGCTVSAAKYSPRGDRIAIASKDSVLVYDSNNGCLLTTFKTSKVAPQYNTGLLWFNDDIFVVSDSKIVRLGASARSEWPVPDSNPTSCIALEKHGEFIAYSTTREVTFYDVSTHSQFALIQHHQNIKSIALSPDDRFLAVGGADGNIAIKQLSHITVSVVPR